jgi:hypothetical protein
MRGVGPWAELLRRRFEIAARRHGLALPDSRREVALDTSQFRPPPQGGQFRLL